MSEIDEAIVRAACCLAAVDAEVSDEEIHVLKRLAQGTDIDTFLGEAMRSPAFLAKQLECVVDDPNGAMEVLLAVAAADGMISDGEMLLIKQFADRFQINPEGLRRLRRAAQHAAGEEGNESE